MNKKKGILSFSGYDFDVRLSLINTEIERFRLKSFVKMDNFLILFKIDELVEKMMFLPRNNVVLLLSILNKTLEKKFIVEINSWNILDKNARFPLISKRISNFFRQEQIYFTNILQNNTRSKIKVHLSIENSDDKFIQDVYFDKNTELMMHNEGRKYLKPINSFFPSSNYEYIFVDIDELLSHKYFSFSERDMLSYLLKSAQKKSKIICLFPSPNYIIMENVITLLEIINLSSTIVFDIKSVVKFCDIVGHRNNKSDNIELNFVNKFFFQSDKRKTSIFFDDFAKLNIITYQPKQSPKINEYSFFFKLGLKYDHIKIFEENYISLKYTFLAGFFSGYIRKCTYKDCFQAGLETFKKIIAILDSNDISLLEDQNYLILPISEVDNKKQDTCPNNSQSLNNELFYEKESINKVISKQHHRLEKITPQKIKLRSKSFKKNIISQNKQQSEKNYLSREEFLMNLSKIERKTNSLFNQKNELIIHKTLEPLRIGNKNALPDTNIFPKKINRDEDEDYNICNIKLSKDNINSSMKNDNNKKMNWFKQDKIEKAEDKNFVIYENELEENSDFKDFSENNFNDSGKFNNKEGIYVPKLFIQDVDKNLVNVELSREYKI